MERPETAFTGEKHPAAMENTGYALRELLRPAIGSLVALTLLTGLLYPLLVTGLAKLFFPYEAGGSLIIREGRVAGSALIGQPFDDPRYFWGRPSATTLFPYNSAASSGSNQGPSNQELRNAVQSRIAALRAADPHHRLPVPVDLVTASASGLDPHISPAAAFYQVPRIAKARGLREEVLRALVSSHVHGRWLGIFGEPVVPVLAVNMALDALP